MKVYIKPVVTLFLVLAFTPAAVAESHHTSNPASGSYSTSARIKLRVVIPEFLSFQIVAGAATAEQITFLSAGDKVTDSSDGNFRLRGNTGQTSINAGNHTNPLVIYTAASP